MCRSPLRVTPRFGGFPVKGEGRLGHHEHRPKVLLGGGVAALAGGYALIGVAGVPTRMKGVSRTRSQMARALRLQRSVIDLMLHRFGV